MAGNDDTLFLLLAGVGLVFLLSAARSSGASSGGFSFEPDAPTGSPLGDIVNAFVPMRVSSNGRALIQAQEGLSLVPYGDAGGYSIGYGHHFGPAERVPPQIDQAQADAYFNADVGAVESTINGAVQVALSQNQYDALADFVFNEGAGHFLSSTLLSKLNAGDYAGAAAEFSRWDISSGHINPALQARRGVEQSLFGSPAGTPAGSSLGSPAAQVAAGTPTAGSPSPTQAA